MNTRASPDELIDDTDDATRLSRRDVIDMNLAHLGDSLRASLKRQRIVYGETLILNPVENLPLEPDWPLDADFLRGLYNSDKVRTPMEQRNTIHQFGGRQRLAYDCRRIYAAFAHALGAAEATLRVLSGLHAHIILFMAGARVGQTVLLLPERAGGHMSTKVILERLGLRVVEMVADIESHCVDVAATVRLATEERPDFVFVDRSEGLIYEDFRDLVMQLDAVSIFDASQYLTNIIAGEYPSPFDMGFDLIVASLHKNFPGPQQALIAAKSADPFWRAMTGSISAFVSNMHVFNIYCAGVTLSRIDALRAYSQRMLQLTAAFDEALQAEGVRVVPRPRGYLSTHHLWIQARNREHAFDMFKALERCRILVNYRLLPYDLGVGLRLGLNSAARLGMLVSDAAPLARIVSDVLRHGAGCDQRQRARGFIRTVWDRYQARGTLMASTWHDGRLRQGWMSHDRVAGGAG